MCSRLCTRRFNVDSMAENYTRVRVSPVSGWAARACASGAVDTRDSTWKWSCHDAHLDVWRSVNWPWTSRLWREAESHRSIKTTLHFTFETRKEQRHGVEVGEILCRQLILSIAYGVAISSSSSSSSSYRIYSAPITN